MPVKKTSQVEKLYMLLSDYLPHSTVEIMSVVYGDNHLGLARVGARIKDIKRRYLVDIAGKHDLINKSIYWYKMSPKRDRALPVQAYTEEAILIREQQKQKTIFG